MLKMQKIKAVVVAVPGSGKTTLLERLRSMIPHAKVVNFGDIMLEEARKRFRVEKRDDMRKLIDLDGYRQLQKDAAITISKMEGIVIIDTHSAVRSPYGYYPGLPSEVVDLMKPDVIINIEMRPEDVIERRAKDIGPKAKQVRDRPIDSLESVREEQEVYRQFAVAAANHAMCYYKLVKLDYPQQYDFQHAEEGAKEVAKIINDIASLKSRRGHDSRS